MWIDTAHRISIETIVVLTGCWCFFFVFWGMNINIAVNCGGSTTINRTPSAKYQSCSLRSKERRFFPSSSPKKDERTYCTHRRIRRLALCIPVFRSPAMSCACGASPARARRATLSFARTRTTASFTQVTYSTATTTARSPRFASRYVVPPRV